MISNWYNIFMIVNNNVRKVGWENVRDNVRDNVWKNVSGNVSGNVWENVSVNILKNAKNPLDSGLRREIR